MDGVYKCRRFHALSCSAAYAEGDLRPYEMGGNSGLDEITAYVRAQLEI